MLTTDPDFASYLGTAFDQIRANAQAALAIYLRLFEALGTVARGCPAGASLLALRQQAALTLTPTEANLTIAYAFAQVHARYQELQARPGPLT